MKKEFDFKFLNMIMYAGAFIALFYVLRNLGIVSKIAAINSALVPVYVGIVICFLSNPLARKLKKMGMNKNMSAIVSLVIIYTIIAVIIGMVIPLFVEQLTSLLTNLPELYKTITVNINDFMHNKIGIDSSINLNTDLKNLDFIKKHVGSLLNFSITTLQSVFSFIVSLFTTIVVSFFLVKDMDEFKQKLLNLLSNGGKNKARYNMLIESESIFMSYVKGVCLDSMIVGLLTTILCLVLGIDYAVVFGLLITILNFIPYIGALLSEVIISLYAITVGGPLFAVFTFIMLVVIQIIDANILQPNIVAKSVDLHPIVVFIGLIIGNLLMGMVGMIIVVPVLAVIKTVIKYFSLKDKKVKS